MPNIIISKKWLFCSVFIFLFGHIALLLSMDSEIFSCQIQKSIPIFDPIQAFKMQKLWSEVIPGEVVILPDAKGVVISYFGKVYQLLFDDEKICTSEPIIQHCSVQHYPMIKVAKKKDGALIVSAGNYINEHNKCVSEYISFYDGICKLKKLDWPIQAISLDCYGAKLAIAGENSVMVVDLDTDKYKEITNFRINKNENRIIDIAMHPEGAMVAVVTQKWFQLISIAKQDNNINLNNLTRGINNDSIKNLYYPSLEELLCITEDGQAKRVRMYDIIEANDEGIKTNVFAYVPSHDKVAVDQCAYCATAHWSDNIKGIKDLLCKIKVFRKNQHNVENFITEKFILEVPEVEKSYDYITDFGQRAWGTGHLLNVALRDNCIVALATDGQMRVWSLIEKIPFTNQESKEIVKNNNSPRRGSCDQDKTPNRRIMITSDNSAPNERASSRGSLLRQQYKRGSGSSSPKDSSPSRSDKRNSIDYEKDTK